MIKLDPKKPYEEFAICNTVFKIDFSYESQYRFNRLWPSLEAKMLKALEDITKVSEQIKALPDTRNDKAKGAAYIRTPKQNNVCTKNPLRR